MQRTRLHALIRVIFKPPGRTTSVRHHNALRALLFPNSYCVSFSLLSFFFFLFPPVRPHRVSFSPAPGPEVETEVEIATGVTMTFVLVPPGKFWMGSPPDERGKNGRYPNESLHVVTLTEPFDLGKYEVTQAQYQALTGKDQSLFKGGERPVEWVTWNEADALGQVLTKQLSDEHTYRLATEAEWEYSCRGGRPSSQAFGVGDGGSLTPRDANFDNVVGQTSKVGSYAANALGLNDMHGNVWEWCADWNEPYPNEAVTDPFRATGGPYRVARGGCHNEPAPECRSALRQGSPEGAGTAGWGSAWPAVFRPLAWRE